jgi:hypothetical protein
VGRCCVCVWGPARARERETGRERARTFNRLDEALEYWIDMIWCNYSLFLSSFNTHTLRLFFPLPADCRPAAPSLPCVCHPSLYTVVVVVALYPTNTTNKEKIERHSAEKRDGIGLNFHVAQASCTSLRFFQIIISHTHTHRKKGRKKKKIGKEKKSIGCWEIEYMW